MVAARLRHRQPVPVPWADVASAPVTITRSVLVQAAYPLILLAAWTLFVWIGRLRNIVAADDLEGLALVGRLITAVGFTAAGVLLSVVLVWYVTTRHPLSLPLATWLGLALSAVGALFWLIRGSLIAFGDYDAGFKVVHSILAVVTIGLGAVVLRWARQLGNT